jgi:hypothetical protein
MGAEITASANSAATGTSTVRNSLVMMGASASATITTKLIVHSSPRLRRIGVLTGNTLRRITENVHGREDDGHSTTVLQPEAGRSGFSRGADQCPASRSAPVAVQLLGQAEQGRGCFQLVQQRAGRSARRVEVARILVERLGNGLELGIQRTDTSAVDPGLLCGNAVMESS